MSMNFLEDTDDWPEYDIIKADIRRLETQHVESRKKLLAAESAFRSDPESQELKTRVNGLKKKMKEIEKRLEGALSMYR
ncbi:hypothetical protein [Desulfobacula sp.]|uniref:Uncharacterized protein n=1 Tax=Candidatus Desulfatibia vada TaxID=2841696 RepID=A0A8J6TQU7_9BACT|nr:hypothetical protein [Candidatus Desulfatibia vada]MBL6995588.1 hypothetical protein [Desulfobacula sp.]